MQHGEARTCGCRDLISQTNLSRLDLAHLAATVASMYDAADAPGCRQDRIDPCLRRSLSPHISSAPISISDLHYEVLNMWQCPVVGSQESRRFRNGGYRIVPLWVLWVFRSSAIPSPSEVLSTGAERAFGQSWSGAGQGGTGWDGTSCHLCHFPQSGNEID